MPKKPSIKLMRLRASLGIYKNLDKFLEFLKEYGYDSISKNNDNWKKLENKLKKEEIRGLDLGDLKSTFRMLDLVQNSNLSEFGLKLYRSRNDEEEMKRLLAAKMIKEKDGWAYCKILSIMSGRSREEIAEMYQEVFDPGMQEEHTDISKYNIFLEWLGITKKTGRGYIFIQERFEKLTGIEFKDIELIDKNLKYGSKICLLALIRLNSMENKSYNVKDIRKTVLDLFGKKLNTHHMQHYADELRRMEFIEYSHRGRGKNKQRGSVGQWKLNEENRELKKYTLDLLQKFFLSKFDWNLEEIIYKSFKTILKEMKNPDRHKRGIALEQFASKICWVMGLRDIKNRTLEEGVELDVTANKVLPFFTKFLIQCKNHKNSIGVPVLAKELGIASVEKYNHVMIFSTSGFVSEMRPYVNKAIISTGINIYLFDNEDIEKMADNSNAIYEIFARENRIIENVREGKEDYWSQFSE